MPQRHRDTEFWNYKHCHGEQACPEPVEWVESMFGVNGGYAMKWEMVELNDICELITCGVAKRPEYHESGIPFLSSLNVKENKIILKSYKYISREEHERLTKYSKPERGDILYTRVGSYGEATVIDLDFEFSIFVSLTLIKPKHNLVDNRFLMWHLNSPTVRKFADHNTSGIGVQNLNVGVVRKYKIPLPPLTVQKEIAEILDTADALRKKDNELLKKYDELAQSIFIEMFGDPVRNEKGWEEGIIRDIVTEAKYGTSKPSEELGDYIYLRMNNITYSGDWNLNDLKYINLEKDEIAKYTLKKGDIIFNRTNSKELVGKTAVFNFEDTMAIAGYLIRVRTNERSNPYYISGYLNSVHGKSVLRNMCKSIIGMANINANELQDINIKIPPIELQNKYEERYLNIQKQKEKELIAITHTNNLFHSLLQKAFKGELT